MTGICVWVLAGIFAKPSNFTIQRLCCDWRASLKVGATNGRKGQGNSYSHCIILLHLPSLCTATFTYQIPFFSFEKIGRGELRRSEVIRVQRQQGLSGRGGGLTFHPLFRFVYRTLSFASLPLMKGRRAKTPQIETESREKSIQGGGYCIYNLGLCLWRSLGLTESNWGGAVFGCLDARWECCLSLFDVPGPFSSMPSPSLGCLYFRRIRLSIYYSPFVYLFVFPFLASFCWSCSFQNPFFTLQAIQQCQPLLPLKVLHLCVSFGQIWQLQ